MIMDLPDGRAAVEAARNTAEAETLGKSIDLEFPLSFASNRGVFVTVSEYPSMELRGCIGISEPVFPLKQALSMAAVSVCHDPRFDDLSFEETGRCVFSVTVLTRPEEIRYDSREELFSQIELGKDGLIMECAGRAGLFLPQVPAEQGWGKDEFISNLAYKAGLQEDAWAYSGTKIRKFRGEIFAEETPRGNVVRKG